MGARTRSERDHDRPPRGRSGVSAGPGEGERLKFSDPDITEAEAEAVLRVLHSGWLTTGSESQAFEEELAAYLDVAHVVAVSSCTAALEVAYAALDLPVGARVGVPAWTFVSSALAAARQGATIVLLDVDPDTLNLAPAALEPALGSLDAVVGVHFGGVPLAAEVRALCAGAGVPLIEDAAHALGARDDRGRVAGQGTAGAAFSFYATKNLASGEGGALATDDPELARFARSFRLHGMDRDAWARYLPGRTEATYDVTSAGIKANFPDLLAAVARAQLGRFDALQARRRELVAAYRSGLAAIEGLRCVPERLVEGSADHLMAVVLPDGADRPAVRGRLSAAGIDTSVHFTPLHRLSWFASSGGEVGPGGLPVAEGLEARALSLPLHTRLTVTDVERVCAALAEAVDGSGP